MGWTLAKRQTKKISMGFNTLKFKSMKKITLLFHFYLITQNINAQSIKQMIDSLNLYQNYNEHYVTILRKQDFYLVDSELKELRFIQNGKYQKEISWLYLRLLETSKGDKEKKAIVNNLLDFCLSDSLKYCKVCESISEDLQNYEASYFDNLAINKIIKIFKQTNQVEVYKGQKNDYPKGETILLGGMLTNRLINEEIQKLLNKNNYRYTNEVHLALARSGHQESINYCIDKFYKENTFDGKIYVKDLKYISYIRNKATLPFYEVLLFDENTQNAELDHPGFKRHSEVVYYLKKDVLNFPLFEDLSYPDFSGKINKPIIEKIRKWFIENKNTIRFKTDKF